MVALMMQKDRESLFQMLVTATERTGRDILREVTRER